MNQDINQDMNKEIEKRVYQRDVPTSKITVNSGTPYVAGLLHDISVSGVAIMYPENIKPINSTLEIGQEVILILNNKIKLPAIIVRVFETGFASKFDFSLNIKPKMEFATIH